MYLALYRKWRPRTFEDVISQPHITQTLKNEVQNNRLAHAYLFTGPRGTGKTTCSKILSMAVNCKNPVDGDPCMICDSCVGIEQGSILDVVEMDAASNNGVDHIRQLREEANYTPTQCKYRVYIIDEAHMLSTGAFNALLKIMEEPPSHVLFILATTEAHKVPATILSRCQRFDFRRIKTEDIAQRLLSIANLEEAFTLEQEAATLIARLADGGMRDALSLLDQCVAYSPKVTTQIVVDAAGIAGRDYLFELTDCLVAQDATGAVTLIDKLYSMSKDLQSLLEELIFHFRNIMLTKAMATPQSLVSVLPGELEQLIKYSEKLPLSVLLSILGELQDCLDKMGKSIDRRLCFEMCLIKICTPSLNTSNEALLQRIDKLEALLKSGAFSTTTPPTVESKTKPKASSIKPVLPKPTADVVSEPVEIASGQTTDEIKPLMEWAEILATLNKTDQPLWGILQNSKAFVSGGFIYIDSPSGFAVSMMKQEGNAAKVIGAVEAKTGNRYKLRVKSSAKEEMSTTHLLDEFLSNAKNLGVEINEN